MISRGIKARDVLCITWGQMAQHGSKSRDVCTGSLQIRFVSTILPPFIFKAS